LPPSNPLTIEPVQWTGAGVVPETEEDPLIKTRGVLVLCVLLFGVSDKAYPQETAATRRGLTADQIRQVVKESQSRVRATLEKEMYLPGVAVALVSRDEVLWSEAFGYRDATRSQKADTNTLFGILSISKTVTVTGLMRAAQEGLINLDVPIATYLPDFHIQSRWSRDPMSVITIRHLLSMTSGLTHDAPIGNNADAFTPSYEAHIRSIARTWPRFTTGERAEYSNLGVELAAYILEKVTRRPFIEYVHEKVFEPLGMTRSTYDMGVIRKDGNRATGNNKILGHVPLENPMMAPGGMYASITDMARFIQFHLNGGRVHGTSVIEEAILQQMQTVPFPLKDQIAGYGQGLFVGYYHLGGEDVRWLGHGGGGFGFRCQMKWLPELGYGVIVMTNSQDHDNVNENEVEEILLKIIELVTGKKDQGPSEWLARHMPSRTVDSSYLPSGLEGRFNGTNDDMLFLIKDGQFGYASGNAFVPVTPVSEDSYLSRRYAYRFIRDGEGRVVSVVRPYDGAVWVMGSPRNEAAGPGKRAWNEYTGTYVRKRFGVSEKFYIVSVKNGWLHFEGSGQDFLLAEHLPGLFFTPDGEAVDFRSSPATFRNIKLYKVRD
jgi:CubicO group peptidase (beta-lactamase class C family)